MFEALQVDTIEMAILEEAFNYYISLYSLTCIICVNTEIVGWQSIVLAGETHVSNQLWYNL